MKNETIMERQKELNELLKKAAKAYYQESKEIMTNFEYDKLYDELVELESKTGIVYSDSVTTQVGYTIVSELPKKKHPEKMLSLDKTKDKENLKEWLKNKNGCLSFKLDGLTVVLTYENGSLKEAITRGNGEIGEVVTENAKHFKGVPSKIPFLGKLVLRGEALMTYENFNKVNREEVTNIESFYKNPRNLASGTIRQLNSEIVAKRGIDFYAFTLVEAENYFTKDIVFTENYISENKTYRFDQYSSTLDWLSSLGFQTVEHKIVSAETLEKEIDNFSKKLETNLFPSDGLVLFYEDILYGRSLGTTSKFPRNGMAFKWKDETAQTTLLEIEWSPSRTGLLNPVAIFEPVELEGTTVTRASVHNVSIVEELKLYPGDKLSIFKANMIIPQVAENLTQSLKNIKDILPTNCPLCNSPTSLKQENDSKTLICTGQDCPAKHIGRFQHFVGRDAMNLIGLAGSKLEDLVQNGFVHNLVDFYTLEKHQKTIKKLRTNVLENFLIYHEVNIEEIKEKFPKFFSTLETLDIAKLIKHSKVKKQIQAFKEKNEDTLEYIEHMNEFHKKIYEYEKNLIEYLDGWGLRSAEKLFEAIEKSKNVEVSAFLYSLGIENIGRSVSKDIAKNFHYDLDEMIEASEEELLSIDGMGEKMVKSYMEYFHNSEHLKEIEEFKKYLHFITPDISNYDNTLEGLIFVITGSLEHYPNRNALKDMIESKGGKVTGSVTSKTSYLINNDTLSNSGKNKKAKELSIPIISEQDFLKLL